MSTLPNTTNTMSVTDLLSHFRENIVDCGKIAVPEKEQIVKWDVLDRIVTFIWNQHFLHVCKSKILDHVGLEIRNDKGSFVKRFARYLKSQHQYTMTSHQKSHIGSLISSSGTIIAHFDVVSEFFGGGDRWDAGEFGDKRSCFWGEYAAHRAAMSDSNDYFAARFYNKKGHGVGRCWVALNEYYGVGLFNEYGEPPIESMVSHIKGALEDGIESELYSYCLSFDGGLIYLNDAENYVISTNPSHTINGDSFDMDCLDIDAVLFDSSEVGCCDECREDTYSGCRDDAGTLLCEDCYDELYAACYECGSVVARDESIVDEDGDYYCLDCGVVCDSCGQGLRRQDVEHHDHDGCYLCERCYDSLYFVCDECGDTARKEDSSNIGNMIYCPDCITVCEHCQSEVLERDTDTTTESTQNFMFGCCLCDECYAEYEEELELEDDED